MRRVLPAIVLLALVAAACGGGEREAKVGGAPASAPDPPAGTASVLSGSVPLIDGTPQALTAYRGRVVLVVNTASRCGYTPQYEGLQTIYERYADQGFVILGFPSDDFQQELSSDDEVKTFCSTEFGVTFPLFSRTSVLGSDANTVFAALAAQPDGVGAPPEWNFTKYLLNRDGVPVQRFRPNVEPTEPRLTNVIEALVAAAPPAAAAGR